MGGLDERWWTATEMGPSVHSSHCRHRNRLCLCSHKGEFCPVWDSQSQGGVGNTHRAFCCGRSAPGCLCAKAHSVGKQQDSQVTSMQTVSWREKPCFSNSWKKCFELWRNLSVTVSVPAPGGSVLHFSVMHSWDIFSGSASCYPTLSGFLGHQLNMQRCISFNWLQIWVFDPWKGNLPASKASPEKAKLQSTESHSHTESHLICFPYISSKSSYKNYNISSFTSCSTWGIYFRCYYT